MKLKIEHVVVLVNSCCKKMGPKIYFLVLKFSDLGCDLEMFENLEGFDDPEAHKLEIGMIKSQLNRITEMAELAINHEDLKEKIKDFKNNLPEDVFEEDYKK